MQCVMDLDTGEPKDEILPQVLAQLGCEATTPSEIARQKPEGVMKQIQAGLDEANKKAVSNAQKVREEGPLSPAPFTDISLCPSPTTLSTSPILLSI